MSRRLQPATGLVTPTLIAGVRRALVAGVRPTVIVGAIALVLAGCGGSSSPSAVTDATAGGDTTGAGASTAATLSSPGPGCQAVAQPSPKGPFDLKPPKLELDPSKIYTAAVATSCGTFAIRLDVRDAPRTAASFVALVRRGFYDGLTFHRIVPDFVIQGGDPAGDGSGGPGYTVVEAPPRNLVYRRGVVAMAKTASDPAGASGSQFFVVTAANAGLPPEYALLGTISSGLDVVERIGALQADSTTGQPNAPVVINRIKISISA